ncbi:cytidylyltransferase domain-containing protein [Clostridium beijerinckii]|uniref:cytidylyltransferase domain-containing protein n=1 Tax=Clostridium beijerinckii TaxID=1520 RepID=UPI0014940B92|nr:glycosyltransferase family protein [Clostridium beijerinckii]NOW05993.1 spore coat polysaccharide biosynthesis protein SpsF [Clostridium beijerinckii]NYC00863.1 spore coat polysaccharide biosynthesis protein SpsF [Clostridium beijerinckii]
MKVVCIIQARMGSSRLPGKVLKKICGKTILEHEVNRLKLVYNIDEIVIATTVEERDKVIVEEANRLKVKYFRGSENDVLSRYYLAAKENNADVVIRVTSDCPCMDSRIIEDIVDTFKKYRDSEKIDYMSNTLARTFPRGYDVEIFNFDCLENAFLKSEKDYEREHVTPYLYDFNNKFKIKEYKNSYDYSNYRVTLDTIEDLKVIESIFERLYCENSNFHMQEVVEFLKQNPEVVNINAKIEQKKIME